MISKHFFTKKSAHQLCTFVFISLWPVMAYLQTTNLPEDPYAGKKVFNDKGCIQCHSVRGSGGKEGPNLTAQKFCSTFLGLAAKMWNHTPNMLDKAEKLGVSLSEMSDEEVSQLIAYLCFTRYFGEEGKIFIGKKLLRTKGCLKCHTIGEGAKVGPDFTTIESYVSPLYMAQAMWNHGPKIFEAEQELGIKHIKLKGKDIIDITTALQDMTRPSSVSPEFMSFGDINNGKQVYRQKGCANCHEVQGEQQPVGPDLRHVDLSHGVLQIAEAMWNHGPAMWKKMSDQQVERPMFNGTEMADLAAYLFYIQYTSFDGDANRGEKLFAEKSCGRCHSPKTSTAANVDLQPIPAMTTPMQMVQAMWNHAPLMKERMKEEDLKWPKFEEDEMIDLYAFLRE